MKRPTVTTLLSIAILASGLPAQAQSSASDGMPVVLGSNCDHQLRTPGNSIGYMNSGDCNSVYVLPNEYGKIELTAFNPTTAMLMCRGVQEYEVSKARSASQISRLRAKIGETSSAKKRREYEAMIADITKGIGSGHELYKDKPAAVAQLSFSNRVRQSDIDAWQNENIELIRTKRMIFKPAPIISSVLTFGMPRAEAIDEDFLLSADIPNLSKKQVGNMRTVPFNGSSNGQVVLSLYGACALVDKATEDITEVHKLRPVSANLSAYLVANQTFEVPSRSRMSYKAVLKKDEFIQYLNEFGKNKTVDFKIHEFVNRNGNGVVDDIVDFHVETTEMTLKQSENWELFRANFQSQVANRLSTRMLQTLEALNFLELTPESLDDAPEPGTIYVDGIQTKCSSSSILGVRVSGGCSTYSVKIPKQVDGSSRLIDAQSVHLDVQISESMTIDQPFNYLYTSGFVSEVK